MSIGESLRRWRDVSRLRRQTRRSPSPSAYGELAERLIAFAETEAALEVAEEGLLRFPDSERLAQVRLFAKKNRLTGDLRKLRDDVLRRPTPVVYTQLATIYRELGQDDDALQTAQECAERFPLNENPYLIQGEIRLGRFLRDTIARDGILSEQALRRVTRINARNVRAHLLLAELHWVVGSVPLCRAHLRTALEIHPTPEIHEFLRDIGADSEPVGDPSDSIAVAATFEELARVVEEQGAFARPPERFPSQLRAAEGNSRARARLDVDSLLSQVVDLGSHDGVRNSIVLEKDGSVLADATDESVGLTRKQFADLVVSVAATADDASRRMDTGALVRAEIESPSGNVTVTRVRNLTIGVLYADPMRGERVWEMLQDYVARNMTSSVREGAHA